MKRKLLIICGPTAAGKTDLGIKLAKKFSGEIISADSRQVYKGMDIGTGKDKRKFSIKKVPVWLLDVCRPNQEFNVADYQRAAFETIENIWQRNKLAIVIGGTGLYIKSLIEKMPNLGIPPNKRLRRKLEKLTLKSLQEELRKADLKRFIRMNDSDRNNPRRLIRAIEIVLSKQRGQNLEKDKRGNFKIKDFLVLGLKTKNLKKLYERIDKRVESRIKEGIKKEVEKLYLKYSRTNSVLKTTIGYKEWQAYFKGEISEEEAIRNWRFSEHSYARRQLTWFRKQPRIYWLDIGRKNFDKGAKDIVQQWYGED